MHKKARIVFWIGLIFADIAMLVFRISNIAAETEENFLSMNVTVQWGRRSDVVKYCYHSNVQFGREICKFSARFVNSVIPHVEQFRYACPTVL
jgi:hypothetical protein